MRTEIKTSLTGHIVEVSKGALLANGLTVPGTFRAEVISTWFDFRGYVETVEVIVPGYERRMAISNGWACA